MPIPDVRMPLPAGQQVKRKATGRVIARADRGAGPFVSSPHRSAALVSPRLRLFGRAVRAVETRLKGAEIREIDVVVHVLIEAGTIPLGR